MKKYLFAFFIIAIYCLASCGPKRYSCGARGICDVEQQDTKKSSTVKA